jgi:hypothetical protein
MIKLLIADFSDGFNPRDLNPSEKMILMFSLLFT